MDDPDFFLPAAAALRAGVPELRIHAAIRLGEVRTVLYRGQVRIPAESLAEFRRHLGTVDTGVAAVEG
jgi:hypothetical protein